METKKYLSYLLLFALMKSRLSMLKHDLEKIYNRLRLINKETASKEYIQKTIGDKEGMTTMKAYNTGSYF